MDPVTREELFLAAAAGESVTLPEPVTRTEIFLKKIAENVANGGSGSDSSQNANVPVTALTMQYVGQLFPKPENRKYVGWALGNVQYDAAEDTVNVLVNVANVHSVSDGALDLYLFKMNPHTMEYTLEPIVKNGAVVNQTNADAVIFAAGTKGAYTYGFCIASNGDYLFMPNYCTVPYLFRSSDHGASWTVSQPAFDSDPTVGSDDTSAGACFAGLMQTSTGRLVVSTHSSYFWYSDDSGANWTKCATPTTHTFGHEACIVELAENELLAVMRKRWQSTSDNTWSGTRQIDPAFICYSHDNGASWTDGVDSATITEMSATGCAIAKIGDRLELYATSRYPHLDTYGVIYQHAASVEDALADNWSNGKVLTYSKAKSYDDFGYPGCCVDGNGNVHLCWYDGDADESGNTNYYYAQGYSGVSNIPVNADSLENASPSIPYSAAMVKSLIDAAVAKLNDKINQIIISGGGTVDDPDYYVTDGLVLNYLYDADYIDVDAGTITDTLGNVATTTITDGVLQQDIRIPKDVVSAKMSGKTAFTVELAFAITNASAITGNAELLQNGTYEYYPWVATTSGYIWYTKSDGSKGSKAVYPGNDGYGSFVDKANGFQHFTAVFDSGKASYYKNGELFCEYAVDDFGSWDRAVNAYYIVPYGENPANAETRAFRAYDRALTADEVTQNYEFAKTLYA